MDAKGNIEVWLQRLVDGMQGTVKAIIKRAVRNVQVGGEAAGGLAGGIAGGLVGWWAGDASLLAGVLSWVH